jgi:signal peptidase I
MNFNFWRKKKKPKPKSPAREWLNAVVFAVVAATLIRWTAVEAFVVPTASMENTILVGDYLFVSKFHYGTRTTTTPLQVPLTHQKIWGTNIPSYLDWITLPSYRLPGVNKVKRGDVVVFNVPPLSENEGVDYPVQLKTYYVKRCVGLPGDRVEITDRSLMVNGDVMDSPANMKFRYTVITNDVITQRSFQSLGLDHDDYTFLGRLQDQNVAYSMLLTRKQHLQLSDAEYIISVTSHYMPQDSPEQDIFPSSGYSPWNGDYYGPLQIPKKGMKIDVNESTLAFYGETILLYEPGEKLSISQGQLIQDGIAVDSYTFKQDYYFMMGDNRHNSRDSRYWGFVPEDHVVGKALFIWLSLDYEADFLHKVRWNRLFTRIE